MKRISLIAIALWLTGCGVFLTPMPENQIAPHIEMERWSPTPRTIDNYILNYCPIEEVTA